MNPVLATIFRDLAHGTAASALPGSPVVTDVPRGGAILRAQLGAALHRVARRVEPQATRRTEAATCSTA